MKAHPPLAVFDAASVADPSSGNARQVLAAAVQASTSGSGVLALVLETEGSTYADAGAMAFFAGESMQIGWLSGGCLEPEIARHAQQATCTGELTWIELDTRDDEDLFSGSALGCRGRLRIVLVPLRVLPGIAEVFAAWRAGGAVLEREVHRDGVVSFAAKGLRATQQLAGAAPEWGGDGSMWSLPLPPPPEALLLGAGPETPMLLHLLHALGWRTSVVERRTRWLDASASADRHLDISPADAVALASNSNAALVMHHNFELDRGALDALADSLIPFVGLLGPVRRREDLFRLIAPERKTALMARLHSPVGLDLGGKAPEAIALSIAAQLQAWRHGARIA